MKTLNLVYPEKSDIKYTVQRFPDGQQNVVIHGVEEEEGVDSSLNWWEGSPVNIRSRLNNWQDLELIICAVASLRELEVEEIHLYTPYIMGARSDRKFEEGGNNYLRDVICPAINALGLKTVTCIDPHSDVLEACIKGFRKIDNKQLVGFALKDLNKNIVDPVATINKCILISPDSGASKKIYKLAEQIGYKGDVITCSKDRDTEGKLTKLVIPVSTIVHKDYIIIDDICDGGATFLQIAKTLKPRLHKSNKLYLIVTHGIFSKGFEELSKYFDGIYCTNSYSEMDSGVNYINERLNIKQPYPENIVKQLNVF